MVNNCDNGCFSEQFRFDRIDEWHDVRLPRLSNQRCGNGCCLGDSYLDTIHSGVGADRALCHSWKCRGNPLVDGSCINGRSFNRRLPRGDFVQRRNVMDGRH